MNVSDARVWEQLLVEDPELKELAIKAGVEKNPKRVKELLGCFGTNCGDGVVRSEAERDLAKYLFLMPFDEKSFGESVSARIAAAEAAGIDIDDL